MKRDLIAVIWSLLVTGGISKWAFHVAYLERGYKAVGGEYLVILVAYVGKQLTIYLIRWRNWKVKEIVEKREVEELLGCEITDEQFEQALKYARHKQKYIYQREQRKVVLQHWYLVKLTEEYVRNLAFSKFTMDLCSALRDMEKECSDKVRNTLVSNHIVSQPSA